MSRPRGEAWAAARRGEPTAKQAAVLAYVKGFVRANGMPPTLREIGEAVGLASVNGVRSHLTALVRKGSLRRTGLGKSHCYAPVVPDGACPCCGRPTAPDG